MTPQLGGARERRLTCLLLYNIFSVDEAETVADHVRSFARHSRHRIVPVWMFGELHPDADLDRADVLVIHYSIKAHYDFFMSPATRARIRAFPGLKVLFAQDEYYKVNLMNDVLRDLGVRAVFSVAPEGEMRKIYSAEALPDIRLTSVLTGYVADALPHLRVRPWRDRRTDIGYRARKLSAWLGERGQEKWRIAESVLRDAPRYGLSTDVSCLEKDRLYGRQWIEFLSDCKAVLGTGSGGSVLDYTGEIQEQIVQHERDFPDTPFEVLRDRYLRGVDGAINFDVISPRCFDAASLRCLMILYEGWYSGVLTPWRHYVPLKKDHSNMDEVVAVLRDETRAQEIIANAHREIALNPRYSYATMVATFDRVVDELFAPRMRARKSTLPVPWYPFLGLRRRLAWHGERNEKVIGKLVRQWVWRRRMDLTAWYGRRRADGSGVKRKTVVVFFHARRFLPLRGANEAHLLCWKRHSKHRVVYVNVGFGVPWWLVRLMPIDAVIFDTIFLSMHWAPEYFRLRTRLCAPVATLDCPKIAIVQDEFYNTDLVVDFLNEIRVTHVLTCSEEADWRKLYGKLDLDQVKLRTVLTGYVDETRIAKVPAVPIAERPIHLGYRAWNNPYWLGEHGLKKVQIGEIVGKVARRRGLGVDINNPAALDFLIGDQWYEFLSRCRAVLGVEGGASLLDHDGSVKRCVEAYLAEHPDATFEDARESCFPGRDHEIKLACLSPRHLEACVTRTGQLLLEGNYNGVLRPWDHYIPLKSDYSNVDEALDALADDTLVQGMVNRAYDDVVAPGRWSYRSFVRDIEETIVDPAPAGHAPSLVGQVAYGLLRLRDSAIWKLARSEAAGGLLWSAIRFGRSQETRCRRLVRRLTRTIACRS